MVLLLIPCDVWEVTPVSRYLGISKAVPGNMMPEIKSQVIELNSCTMSQFVSALFFESYLTKYIFLLIIIRLYLCEVKNVRPYLDCPKIKTSSAVNKQVSL